MQKTWTIFVCWAITLGCPVQSKSQQIVDESSREESTELLEDRELTMDASLPNVPAPTLGGSQLWTDHAWRRSWRIQQNALTKHWRLIDPNNIRYAWGSRAACEAALMEAVPVSSLPVTDVVVYLHGLMRTWRSMRPIGEAVHQAIGRPAVYFEYASTRSSIAQHAQALREVLDGLPQDVRLSFVGHSMGNIVLRHAIGDYQSVNDQAMLQRFHRIVMLGPPNQGASIARQLSKTGIYGWITGPGGLELGPGWQEFSARLAVPTCEFGIIAGNWTNKHLSNPLVPPGNDFIVSVEETKLPGAKAHLEVEQMHSFLMEDPKIQESVIRFLETGQF